jgi:hypothetical protein
MPRSLANSRQPGQQPHLSAIANSGVAHFAAKANGLKPKLQTVASGEGGRAHPRAHTASRDYKSLTPAGAYPLRDGPL